MGGANQKAKGKNLKSKMAARRDCSFAFPFLPFAF
jgi:hypothetical protein